MSIINIHNLNKSFSQGREKVAVIKDLDLSIEAGEVISLMGESGSGKSTLLSIIAGLMDFDSGDINIVGENLKKLSDSKKTAFRLKNIGFVYQYHHLLSDFSALENVMIPQLIARKPYKEAKDSAEVILAKLGLSDKLKNKPSELSGGQQQRVAIARALSNSPKIIMADEPTGNLDHENSRIVMDIFLEAAKQQNTTLVIATHSQEISKKSSRVISL